MEVFITITVAYLIVSPGSLQDSSVILLQRKLMFRTWPLFLQSLKLIPSFQRPSALRMPMLLTSFLRKLLTYTKMIKHTPTPCLRVNCGLALYTPNK